MDLSILIPARNEMFLTKTIEDILANIEGDTEVIAVCDGNWPDPPVNDHPRVHLIYHSQPIGQRAATNEAARLSRAKFIMKCDAHCAFDKGFDVKLMADCEPDWTIIPRMYNLHAFDWVCKKCGDRRYQGPTPTSCPKCDNKNEFERVILWKPRLSRKSDFMRFDKELKFNYWGALGKREESKGEIADTMSLIGACWFIHRERYWDLGGMDEAHGSWGQMGTEIACKAWLSGGRLAVNKKTWFAHMFRTQGGDFGFPYHNPGITQARNHSKKLWLENGWPLAKHPLSWLIDKFAPVPDWPTQPVTKGLVYYTDSHCREDILSTCQKQLERCMEKFKFPIISVSQQPINFGINFVLPLERSVLSMYKQILKGIEESKSEVIFLVEHDVLYHPSHFDFIPLRKDRFYYDRSRWALCADTGKAVFYQSNQVSHLCAYRDLMLKHYRKVVENVEREGFKHEYGFSPPRGLPKEEWVGRYNCYTAPFPSVDIRHTGALTKRRMNRSEFRSERSCRDWQEAGEIPGWGKTLGRFDEFLDDIGRSDQ